MPNCSATFSAVETHCVAQAWIGQALAEDAVDQFPGAIPVTGTCLRKKMGRAATCSPCLQRDKLALSTLQALDRGDYRLETTSADTIDRLCRHLIRQTGSKCDLTGRIHAVARLQDIADDHIGDIFGGKPGQNRLGCNNAQVYRRTVF